MIIFDYNNRYYEVITHMKNILMFLASIVALASCGAAKQVGYNHKLLSDEGCTVYLYAAQEQDNTPLIVVTVQSDRLVFSEEPTMLLKTFDGTVIESHGKNINASSTPYYITSGSVAIPVNTINAMAQFPITDDEIELLKYGISKIRLTTIPIQHEKEFKVDIIGKRLYKLFQKVRSTDSSF